MGIVLTVLLCLYVLIGLVLTAFCVHMSYHESAVGFGDEDDRKAQRLLESKFGLLGILGLLFLFCCWPLALLIAYKGKQGANPGSGPDAPC